MKRPHTLIVGGAKGIGTETVRQFVKLGHKVSVFDRLAPDKEVRHYWVELADEAQLDWAIKDIVREGVPDNVVFFQRFRGEGDAWKGEMEVSATATHTIIERLFKNQNGGCIVIVCSCTAQLVADSQPVGYHAVKAALQSMVRYYAVTLGPQNVRVNSVSPGAVMKDEARRFYTKNKPMMRLYKQVTPLGRMGRPDDIAKAIEFLCSPEASFITGHDLVVDGGLSKVWQESLARKVAGLT